MRDNCPGCGQPREFCECRAACGPRSMGNGNGPAVLAWHGGYQADAPVRHWDFTEGRPW